ncbi:MAG: carboxymuconolactone decarboxylase family protein [Pseudomonadales bacterium]|nr:carboxymuconolactone decarboxylase family protein [Pseudomonadales bacterium]
MSFTLHTIETAPQKARESLKESQKAFGWLPNLHRVLAEAPAALQAYKDLHTTFQNTSFNAVELTVVWQTINFENQCHYCLPAHSMIAKMMKVDDAIIEALKQNQPLTDKKLEVLRNTTRALLLDRGHLSAAQIDQFKAVGYGNQQLMEIIVGLAQKTISNYVNHLSNTPLDDQFKKFA